MPESPTRPANPASSPGSGPVRLPLLSTWVTPVDFETWVAAIADGIRTGTTGMTHGGQNLHGLYLLQRDADMERFYRQADLALADGQPLLWLLRAAGLPRANCRRLTMMDRFPDLLAHAAANGWRMYYLGSTEASLAEARRRIARDFPTLQFASHHGYFDPEGDANSRLRTAINDFRPDLLLVGMGMPRQERWILRNHAGLQARHIIACGATIDYYSGAARRPPAWLGPLGLAGLYRLATDPRRLWRRYLVEPWVLLATALPWIIHQRRRRGDHE